MRHLFKTVFCFVLLAFSISVPAQNLPALAKDGTVSTGTLQNGITYYLVTNSITKGVADFALVRKGCSDTLASRQELVSLPHFNKTIPYRFLSRKGIGCRPEGYMTYDGGNTAYRFDDVPLFDQAASDTTLLMLFDIIASKPCQHALVIAGDITPAALLDKMKVFSMMVPSRNPSYQKTAYTWTPSSEAEYSFTESGEVSSLKVDFRYQRTPDALMNTIQPFISGLYVLELKEIVENRMREMFAERSIPASEIGTSCLGSADTAGDEHFTLWARTSSDQLVQATLAVASVLSEISARGVEANEYTTAKAAVLRRLGQPRGNEDLVRECISSYLYGSDLASVDTKIKFLTSRPMDAVVEARLFNNYISAILSDTDNMKVSWTGVSDEFGVLPYELLFKAMWNSVATLDNRTYEWKVSAADTTRLWNGKGKTKFKNAESEFVSGGETWTYDNGMKVIYKKLSTTGKFAYSLMIRGGYTMVGDLGKGEGAFFSDMLSLCSVAGMSGRDFIRLMNINGIEMKYQVSGADLRIYGEAPSNRLDLLMKGLLSIADERKPDNAAFVAYRKAVASSLKPAFLDSLMYKDYVYSPVKTPSGLTDQTYSKALNYFNSEFIRVNDGVLVLAGDLGYDATQKKLTRYLGGFRTSKTVSARSPVSYKLGSGSTSYSMPGTPTCVKIGMVFSRPFTTENYMAFRTASLAIKRAVTGAMGAVGFSVAMEEKYGIYPIEGGELILTCTPVPDPGLPKAISGGEDHPRKALLDARKAIVKDLEAEGALVKIEDYSHNVGFCYRHGSTPVEPRLSEQWFVQMKPLAEPAIAAVKAGETRFVPDRFSKIYYNWMENIRDWCISRQLWWGHRIPAWYCDDCGEMTVSRQDPSACPKCGGRLRQDEDVLDTWFSSALWPFETLGWPEKTEDLD